MLDLVMYRRRLRGGASSLAALMLAGEVQGLALDFTDTSLRSATDHYGSARVKDTTTPANAYNSHPYGLLTYSSPSLKLCRGPDGLLRYGAHNLFVNSNWAGSGGRYDPLGDWGPTAPVNGGTIAGITSTIDPEDIAIRFIAASGERPYMGSPLVTMLTGAVYELSFDVEGVVGSLPAWNQIVIISGASYTADYNGQTTNANTTATFQAGDRVYVRFTITTGGSASFRLGIGTSGPVATSHDFTISRPMFCRVPYEGHTQYFRNTSLTSAAYELPYEWDTDGTLLGIRVEEQRTNLFLNNRSPATQGVTVTAAAHTLSFYGTGSITLSGTHSATLNGTGTNDRVTLTFTPTAGTLTCTVSGTIDYVQVEVGSFATSPIVTAGSTVTRAADSISLVNTKWPYTDAAFAAYVRYTPVFVDSGIASTYVVLTNNFSSTEYAQMHCTTVSVRTGRSMTSVRDSGTTLEQVEATLDNIGVSGQEVKFRFSYDATGQAHSVDGGAVFSGAVPSTLPTLATLQIGPVFNGHIAEVLVLPRRVANVDLPNFGEMAA